MNTATELLRRALEDWDFSDTIETLDPIFNEIRAYLAAEPEADKPMAWFEYAEHADAWFLSYRYNPNAKTKPLYLHPPRPEPEAEPIGYAVKMIPRGLHFVGFVGEEETDEEIEEYGPDQIVPLYTRPEPSRKPMTEAEMYEGTQCGAAYTEGFVNGIRFAEKHHGIGGDDE